MFPVAARGYWTKYASAPLTVSRWLLKDHPRRDFRNPPPQANPQPQAQK